MNDRTIFARQALHGYDRGHRLITGSRDIDAESMKLLDRLSDAAGQRPVPDNDGYLTGYPLPNGNYALARTWYAHDAPRPNSVWTHTLLLPHAALDGMDLSTLWQLLHTPDGGWDFDSYLAPLDVTELLRKQPQPIDDPVVTEAVVSLYVLRGSPAWLEQPDVQQRNTLALALWSQQWPRLRRRFAFCTGAIEARRLDRRPFDLLLRPPSHGSRAGAIVDAGLSVESVAWQMLVDDLKRPGPLREFLRRCGPDTARLESALLFCDIWSASERTDQPLQVVFDRVIAAAPRPSQLRRLKRALLRGEQALLLRRDVGDLVDTLARPRIGRAVYEDDAALDDWLNRLWDDRPQALRRTLRTQPRAETHDLETPATVTDVIGRYARDIVLVRAQPVDLGWVATAAPDVAAELLNQRQSKTWWAAFTALPSEQFAALVNLDCGVRDADQAALVIGALTTQPEGALKWTRLAERNEPLTVAAALRRHGQSPDLSETWVQLLRSRQAAFPASLGRQPTPESLAAAASLIDQVEVIDDIPLSSWDRLFRNDRLWAHDSHRTAVLFLAGVRTSKASPTADRLVAHTFARLYEMLAKNRHLSGWELLSPNMPGHHDDWDRCHRLTRAVAAAAFNPRRAPRPGIVAAIPPGAPLTALQEELHAMTNRKKSKGSLVAEIIKTVFP